MLKILGEKEDNIIGENQDNLSSQFLEFFIFDIILASKSGSNMLDSQGFSDVTQSDSTVNSICALDSELVKDLINISSGRCPDLDDIISSNSKFSIYILYI
jgi:hypothetical protein